METKELVKEFEKIPTGNISDAMDDLGLVRQVIPGTPLMTAPQTRVAGTAYTISQMRRRPDSGGTVKTRQAQAVDELAEPGDFIIFANDGRTDICTGGSILARRAKARGVKGFLVDGCFRDVDEIAELQFPVYARGANPVRSKWDLETAELQVPVTAYGIQIRPGDYIIADATGIIAVPAELAKPVLDRAREIAGREERLIQAVAAGKSMEQFEREERPLQAEK